MKFEEITEKDRKKYNKIVGHPLQSYEWGEFRKKTGVSVVRRGAVEHGKMTDGFTLTIHRIPHSPYSIGYLPKGNFPSAAILGELKKIAREYNCIFIQLEPNAENTPTIKLPKALRPSFHPLFTRYNFVLDIRRREEELMQDLHSKTRYNIRVAKKHEVEIVFDNSYEAFSDYLALLEETTSRQGFYAHDSAYHRNLYASLSKTYKKDSLSYHIGRARYQDTSGRTHTLAAWVLFSFGDTLYYPYGASSNLYRFTMASNLICWEAILYGKKLGLSYFDMWGALSEKPDKNDPWYGFHRFKKGYTPRHVEYVGSYDLVVRPLLYEGYKVADRLRWAYLTFRKR